MLKTPRLNSQVNRLNWRATNGNFLRGKQVPYQNVFRVSGSVRRFKALFVS